MGDCHGARKKCQSAIVVAGNGLNAEKIPIGGLVLIGDLVAAKAFPQEQASTHRQTSTADCQKTSPGNAPRRFNTGPNILDLPWPARTNSRKRPKKMPPEYFTKRIQKLMQRMREGRDIRKRKVSDAATE